jgi:hypothetical protein
MPDFGRITRSLELHLASSPEELAFIRGKHAGEDNARWQIVAVVATVAALAVLGAAYLAN